MNAKIKEIKAPLEKELRLFEQKFRQSMRSDVALLNRITHYIVKRKGKQIRPLLVFLTAKLCGDINESTYRAASFVEMIHTATLVHDDVVDESYMRRGFFSINALWKNKVAVLVGDYLFSRSLLLATDHQEYTLLQILNEAVRQMSEGELLQMEKSRKLDITEDQYLEVIYKKTASFIAAACKAGAASTTQDQQRINDMRDLGQNMGMAFQIKDDLFDYGQSDVGKPRGIDIQERKLTLPLIYALDQASSQERKHYIRLLRKHNKDPKRVREVIAFVHESGGIGYTEERMHSYVGQARDILHTFEEGPIRNSLDALISYIIERKK